MKTSILTLIGYMTRGDRVHYFGREMRPERLVFAYQAMRQAATCGDMVYRNIRNHRTDSDFLGINLLVIRANTKVAIRHARRAMEVLDGEGVTLEEFRGTIA